MFNILKNHSIRTSPLIAAGDRHFEEKMMRENNWGPGKTREVIKDYREFLIKCLSGEQRPSADVDKVWHAHILFTEDYFVRWSKILGKTIHHRPDIAPPVAQIPKKTTEVKKRDDSSASCSSPTDTFPLWMTAAASCSSNTSHSPSHSSSHCSSSSGSHCSSSSSGSSCSSGGSCGSSCGGGGGD